MELTLIRNWQIDKQIRKVWNVREEWIQWEHVKQNKANRAVPSLESGKREPGLLPYKALAFLQPFPFPRDWKSAGPRVMPTWSPHIHMCVHEALLDLLNTSTYMWAPIHTLALTLYMLGACLARGICWGFLFYVSRPRKSSLMRWMSRQLKD